VEPSRIHVQRFSEFPDDAGTTRLAVLYLLDNRLIGAGSCCELALRELFFFSNYAETVADMSSMPEKSVFMCRGRFK